GSSRYAIGAPSRNTTPKRFGFGRLEPTEALAVTGASVRVGLNRFLAATLPYVPASGRALSGCWPAVVPAGAARPRGTGMGIGAISWRTMNTTLPAAIASKI